MKTKALSVLIAAVSMFGATGEVLVYDGFSDAPSTNVPAGWVSNEPANNHGYVADGSLSYPGMASTNNSFGLGNKTADYQKSFAELSPPAGGTVYFSALIRMNSGFTKNFNTGAFRLYDSGNIYGNAIMVGVGTSNYATNLMGFSINNRNRNWSQVESVKTPETYVMSNAVHLLVGSYTRGTSGSGSGSVNLWVDPPISATPGLPTVTMASYTETESYDVFEINSGGSGSFPGKWQFDELKIGTNWTDVVSAEIPGSQLPVADFSVIPSAGTVPLTVAFNDLSGGTVTNRYWDFGDGTTTNTSASSVVHVYTTAGTYTVSLIAGGPVGSDTNIQPAAVTAFNPVIPTAGFSAAPLSGDAPLIVFFTDTSTGTITNRHWDFGDGAVTNTTVTNMVHAYSSAGTYSVSLTASGPAGADTDTQSNAIQVTVSTAINIPANLADQQVTESATPVFAWVSAPSARLGDTSTGDRYTYVIPFQLPDLAGKVVSGATLKLYLQPSGSYSSATNIYIDILGGRVNASPAVTLADCNATTAVLKNDAQIVNNTVVSPQAQAHVLDAAFFRSIYANDANAAGKYVFITLRVDNIDPAAANSFLEYTTADGANPPLLLFETDRSGPSGIRLDLFTGSF